MGKIILVRHGQTQMNADRIYFGKLDPSLNDLGKIQAQEAKNVWSRKSIAMIIFMRVL